MNMSDTKVGRELGKLGLVKDVKKIGKKTIKIWKGIKKNSRGGVGYRLPVTGSG
jgi:hypothetical protein